MSLRSPRVLICFVLLQVYSSVADKVPHVSSCNFCTTCHVGETPPAAAASTARRTVLRHVQAVQLAPRFARKLATTTSTLSSTQLHEDMFMATAADTVPKQTLPNCTECYGCNTELQAMESVASYFNTNYTNERGATSNWIFKATDPDSGTRSVIKVYCVPVAKTASGRIPVCSPQVTLGKMQLFMALEKLSEDCGFHDIIPKTWVGKVDAVMPNVGYHIRWHGLWMELVQGISLESFLHKGKPMRVPPDVVIDVMQNRLNKTQVVLAAIFDLLTSQCDRHAQNIFIDEQGQLKLIDNEACLQHDWKNCGFDSLFVPTSQKQEIIRLTNQFVLKYVGPADVPHSVADPLLLLDYRCYLEGGAEALGTNYPPRVQQCLAQIAEKTVPQVQEHYGLDNTTAHNLHSRARDMLQQGFEWALKYGEPRNAPPKRYLMQPKCCSIKWSNQGWYTCTHAYQPKYELPYGDPFTGREWTKAKRDTGSFEGGSRFE